MRKLLFAAAVSILFCGFGLPASADAEEEAEAIAQAKTCAAHLAPLWQEFVSFRDDADFREHGFARGYPYAGWSDRVQALQTELADPALSDRDRFLANPCGHPDVAEVAGFPEELTASPTPLDMIQAAQGVFREGEIDRQIGAQRSAEITAFLDWAAAQPD